jgi:3-deoxy-manno-octulosonate cytidylyltransferase (CMP-KDO synthetase)
MIDHQNTIVIIPARMASTRLPGKPLADILGAPLIIHVWKRAVEANVGPVLVACAEMEIARVIKAHGGDAIVTEPSLASGSDRVFAALSLRDPERRFSYVVNLQGDLPTVTPLDVQRCLGGLVNEKVDISTIAAPITDPADVANPNIVKAIAPLSDDREVAFARDFQRLPAADLGPLFWHHIGIYAFRRAALERFIKLPVSEREAERRLEQMRALDNGMSIAVVRVDSVPLGVDTPAELEAARQTLKASRF